MSERPLGEDPFSPPVSQTNQPLRATVEGALEANERAIRQVRETQEERLTSLEQHLNEKVEAGDKELLVRIDALKEANDKLASERDRAAEVLRSANEKAINQAEVERSKAADRLAEQLKQRIESGDENLRLHITAQENQLREELVALERATTLVHAASEKAIDKAEVSTDKRFHAVNEFRAQLSEQSGTYMPREVADAQFSELRKQITQNTDRINVAAGEKGGSDKTIGWMIAGATILISVTVIGVNILLSLIT